MFGQDSKSKLKPMTIMLLYMVSITIDLIIFLLGLTFFGWLVVWLISLLAMFIYGIWFYNLNISVLNYEIGATMVGAFMLKCLPFIGMLPSWTGWVFYMIAMVKAMELFQKITHLTGHQLWMVSMVTGVSADVRLGGSEQLITDKNNDGIDDNKQKAEKETADSNNNGTPDSEEDLNNNNIPDSEENPADVANDVEKAESVSNNQPIRAFA